MEELKLTKLRTIENGGLFRLNESYYIVVNNEAGDDEPRFAVFNTNSNYVEYIWSDVDVVRVYGKLVIE